MQSKYKCNKCKLFKLAQEFPKDATARDGLAYSCRPCKAISRKACKEKRKVLDKKIQELEAIAKIEQKEKELPNIAGPITFVSRGIYKPDSAGYVRNEGLKHIQSRGYRC